MRFYRVDLPERSPRCEREPPLRPKKATPLPQGRPVSSLFVTSPMMWTSPAAAWPDPNEVLRRSEYTDLTVKVMEVVFGRL